MSRCIYCDYSEEIAKDTGYSRWKRTMKWDDYEQGFVCHVCTGKIGDALNEFDEMEGSEFLEGEGLEEHQGNPFTPG